MTSLDIRNNSSIRSSQTFPSESYDLMASSMDATGHATLIYKSALGSFINKQFAEAIDTLEPLLKATSLQADDISTSSWIRLWNLDLAILIRAAEQSAHVQGEPHLTNGHTVTQSKAHSPGATSTQHWSDAKRRDLASKLWNNTIWQQVIDSASDLGKVPPQLIISLMTASIKHSRNLSQVAQKTEEYLVLAADELDLEDSANLNYLNAYLRVFEIYTSEVLTHEKEFDLAIELVAENQIYPESRKSTLLERIRGEKKLSADRAKAQKEQDIQKEQAAMAEEEREQKELKQTHSVEQTTASEPLQVKRRTNLDTTEQEASGSNSSSNNNYNNSSLPFDPRSRRLEPTTHTFTIWKSLYSRVFRKFQLLTVFTSLVPLFIFIFLASRPIVRQKLRAIFVAMWGKLALTFSMGMKVSYV